MKRQLKRMKTSSNLIILAVLAVFFPVFVFSAEIMEDEPYITPVPKKTAYPAATPKLTPAATAKPAPAATVKPAPVQEPVKTPEVSAEAVAELKMKLEGLDKTVFSLKEAIKALEEKNIEAENVARDLELYKKNLEDLQSKNSEDVKKVAELEKSFNGIQDTLKNKMDKMGSWDDILGVLKKGISNNETEIARLKKEINGLKKQYGGNDNIFDEIAQWPYSGFVAFIISIAAFITVVAKP
jgi:hypothetical protein